LRLLERIDTGGEEAATTVITVEEQLRGWLAEIHGLSDPRRQVPAYERLQHRIDFFASWTAPRGATMQPMDSCVFVARVSALARWISSSPVSP
jgi:hypothetical protein